MKKAFDQTVRELKREVNKKVLKVPGIEQKIYDATSNEPWGPHGSLLADIAQATRNYNEYQIIMHVIWKRLNDTGKNWRHVYKSLTILEYLVAHGSERVVDEIREHAYQISTLSDFQYIDSSGKDQGNNVRRKSQALVSLVNDKEKLQEVRQKALANKDKYRPTYSSSGSYKPGSYSSASGYGDRYDDDHYEGRSGGRDDDLNGYGRGKDMGYRDDDRYGRGGDFNRYGDGFGRDSDEHSGRGSYKNDDNRGGRGNDEYQFGPRSKSFDKEKDHSYEEDDSYSYRNGGDKANDASPDERNIERKLSEQSGGAPSHNESAVKNDNNIVRDERDGGFGKTAVPKVLPPAVPQASSPQNNHHGEHHAVTIVQSSPMSMDDTSFDEFDPRGFIPAVNFAPLAASGSGVDLFGNSSSLDPVNSLALVLSSPTTTINETEVATTNSGIGINYVALSSASAALSQPTENPFGDIPFKAIPQESFPSQRQTSVPVASSTSSFPPSASSMSTAEPVAPVGPVVETSLDFGFGDSLGGLTFTPAVAIDPMYSANQTLITSELLPSQPNIDVMSTHLAPSNLQTMNTAYGHPLHLVPGFGTAPSSAAQPFGSTNIQTDNNGFHSQQLGPSPMQSVQPIAQQNMLAVPQNLHQHPGLSSSLTQRVGTTISGTSSVKQSNDTFETKSSVWADTLNRGLVNLNISGSKTNPLADIGVDFDSINRMERRKEKEKGSANPLTSTVAMGKAMGSGSGIGRAGAGAINSTTRPTMGIGMGMAMGGGGGIGMGGPGGIGMGIGGYNGAMNQPMGMNMGMGMSQGSSMRPEMQSPSPGFPGSGYNSMTGMGGYGTYRPYGGGYR